MSSKTMITGNWSAIRSTNSAPGREEILTVAAPRGPSGRAGAAAVARRTRARPGRGRSRPAPSRSFADALAGGLVLDDPGAHPHHLGQRPVRDAVAVGETAAAVPPRLVERARRCTSRTPRRASTCRCRAHATIDSRCARRSSATRVEELLDQAQLTLAPDERRLEPDRPALATPCRDHAQGAVERAPARPCP